MTTIYDYDVAGNLISESEADGTPLRDIVYMNGERIAMRLYGSQAGWYYFVNDHLGTPQKIVDASGSVVWQAAYLPFGKAQVLSGSSVTNNFRFPGQYYDAETELHQNWHRYYMPAKGRYLTPDPIGLENGINLYYYVSDNPVNDIDPHGLESEKVYLYQKVDKDGKHLKFGITKNPKTRYTKAQLGGGRLRILAKGPKEHILHLERNLHKTLPIGPEEGQSAYANIQKQKGLINKSSGLGKIAGGLGYILMIIDFYDAQERAEERGVDVWTIMLEDMGVYFYDPNASCKEQ